jgi:3-hydroxyethyl bacteriochlorophyllide a dehydrogenase
MGTAAMDTIAVVLDAPQVLGLRRLDLAAPGEEDIVVDVDFSGVSTGTERLLWSGRMPPFPGMGYPLVPGYESVGRVREAGARAGFSPGERVFVPGASCYKGAHGLFGGAARRLIAPGRRAIALPENLPERLAETGVLFALAATAHHAIAAGAAPPDLIVGHGVLGRLLARIALARGAPAPTVWEADPSRRDAEGYSVVAPQDDARRDYRAIYDASGAGDLLNGLIARLGRGGEVVLAGFYEAPLSFDFPPAFMRETRLRIAAEWSPEDLTATRDLVATGRLSLEGLITHRQAAETAEQAYRTAFSDTACLKMVLDWRNLP